MIRATVCDGVGSCALLACAKTALPDEILRLCGSATVGHTWLEMDAPNASTLVIDPYRFGPVVYKSHSAFARSPDVQTFLRAQNAYELLHAAADEAYKRLDRDYVELFKRGAEIQDYAEKGIPITPPTRLRNETLPDFITRHSRALQASTIARAKGGQQNSVLSNNFASAVSKPASYMTCEAASDSATSLPPDLLLSIELAGRYRSNSSVRETTDYVTAAYTLAKDFQKPIVDANARRR